MTYCTNDEIQEHFDSNEIAQICSIGGGVLDENRLQRAREYAANLINSHMGTKYALPLSVVVPLLKNCEADLVRYNLYDDNPTQNVVDRFNYWTNWLVDLTRGKITLFDEAGVAVTKTSNASGSDGFFTMAAPSKSFTDEVIANGDLTRWPGC